MKSWYRNYNWGPRGLHLIAKTIDNEKFKCFPHKTFLFYWSSARKSKRSHLQLYWPCFDNNLYKNNICRASRTTKSNKSSNFLYPWTNGDCYSCLGRETRVCSTLNNGVRFERPQQLPKPLHCAFYIKSQKELFF